MNFEALLREMLRIRLVEEEIALRYSEQKMRCPTHLCIGQEAIATGVCATLGIKDKVYSNHRAHGHYLAKGGSLNAMIAELYGKEDGCCGGRGGSMHLIDLEAGFVGATPIVGGTVPLAVGAAWASALRQEASVCVVFFGDGCFEEGVVHESMNFAALHKLPVLFVCENNEFSVYTSLGLRQPTRPIYLIAAAHGLEANCGDGNNVESVLDLASKAVTRARAGLGPQFLEFKTYRWREHCGPDFDHQLNYRSEKEILEGIKNCPIERFKARLNNSGIDIYEIADLIEEEIRREISLAFAFAEASPKPNSKDATAKIYA